MQICPFCASENIFFSKKRSKFFCEDCEMGFDTPSVSKGMRIFLSYGHDKNADVVKKIKEYLTGKGYDVWIDTSEIPAGKDWRERITNGLIGSNGIISFLSKHSVRDPGVCLDELKIAVCLKHAYVKTVLLENEADVNPPNMVRNTQWIDMSNWDSISDSDWNDYFEQKMELLIEALNSDEDVKFNEELEFLSRELNVNNNTSKEQRLLKQTFIGRSWLMESINGWFSSSCHRPFLICGVPGAGKSAFSANLAQFNPNVLAAMFFEWDHSELSSVDTVIKQLAFKLSASLPDYRRMLVSIYGNSEEKKNLEQYHGSALFDYIILNPIHCCIDGNRGRGMIVIDGLDETTAEIADLLIHKATQFPEWIKVLFTSRYDTAIVSRFDESDTVMLDESHLNNCNDIKEYLAYRLDLNVESDRICQLADKCEGSFMYAVAFCDAVNNGSMSVDDIKTVPSGLNNFYYTFFRRIFGTRESFLEIRPFLELLCVEDDVPEEVITDCLKLDRYGLWELRLDLKSLITGAESECGFWNSYKLKVIKLIHQSIKDWLIDEKISGEFYIDISRGYQQLARWSERKALQDKEPQTLTDNENSLYKKVQAIDPKNFSEAQLKELQNEFSLKRAEIEEKEKKRLHDKKLKSYSEINYVKWLILGGEYDKAKEVLLKSFDKDSAKKSFDYKNYTEYYDYLDLWKWADMFPLGYPIDDLVEKITEMVVFPYDYMVSRYSHRNLQISLFILRNIMDSGRYAEAFFSVMCKVQLAAYFTSRASDDGETRDGWDKYYMARDAVICLKKLDKAGIPVPDIVRNACEKMKLTYNYYCGNASEGMFYGGSDGCWMYGILSEPELFKDICTLDVSVEKIGSINLLPLQIHYNTTSLRFYLAAGDEQDFDYINNCIKYHADLEAACKGAIESIEKNAGKDNKRISQSINVTERIQFIQSLMKQE